MPERLPQLLLQKVDNDSVCDVALRPPHPAMAPKMYSKSGTGPWLPWKVLEEDPPPFVDTGGGVITREPR
jgi:hypothetical protein